MRALQRILSHFPSTQMVVKIRLARFGKKHAPIYNIVVAQARSARNSKPIEVLGEFYVPRLLFLALFPHPI